MIGAIVVWIVCVAVEPAGAQVIFSEDFETGAPDWSVSLGEWEIGTATAGPGACNTGSGCAATVLAGTYSPYADTRLESPAIDLPAVTAGQELQLHYWQWFSYSSYDQGQVQIQVYDAVSGWGTWSALAGDGTFAGNSMFWTLSRLDLTAYAGRRVKVGFFHHATRNCGGCVSEAPGWYLDDVQVLLIASASIGFDGDFETEPLSCWNANQGVWRIGTPSVGPNACHGGTSCAATGLDRNYDPYQTSRLASCPVTLPPVSGGQSLEMRMWQWFSYSSYDMGQMQVSAFDGTSWGAWQNVGDPVQGASSVWTNRHLDLTAFGGMKIRVGLLHSASRNCGGCVSESSGWFVDDVTFVIPGVGSTTTTLLTTTTTAAGTTTTTAAGTTTTTTSSASTSSSSTTVVTTTVPVTATTIQTDQCAGAADGTACDNRNSCGPDVCQGGTCVDEQICEQIVAAPQTPASGNAPAKTIAVRCSIDGADGFCAAQGFVPRSVIDDLKGHPSGRAADPNEEIPVTSQARAKFDRFGVARFKLKLNKLGKLLRAKAIKQGKELDVIVRFSVEDVNGQRTLRRIVTLVQHR